MTLLCSAGALVIDSAGSCTRSSALKTNEVPTAWLVEEILRALVVTSAVGSSQNWWETHTHMLRAHLAARGQLPEMSQPLPSLCYLLQQILVVFNKCRFYNIWSEDWNKGLGSGHSKYCCLNCLNEGSLSYFWDIINLPGVTWHNLWACEK